MPSLMTRANMWVETVILTKLTPQNGPGPAFRWIFRIPILFYDAGLGWLVGNRFLLLTTTGRKTGRVHKTPLEFSYDQATDSYIVMAGWGGQTDWLCNSRACPQVQVRVGRRTFTAQAEPLPDAEVAGLLADITRQSPTSIRLWERWAGPMDGSMESFLRAAPRFPSMRLRPVKDL